MERVSAAYPGPDLASLAGWRDPACADQHRFARWLRACLECPGSERRIGVLAEQYPSEVIRPGGRWQLAGLLECGRGIRRVRSLPGGRRPATSEPGASDLLHSQICASS